MSSWWTCASRAEAKEAAKRAGAGDCRPPVQLDHAAQHVACGLVARTRLAGGNICCRALHAQSPPAHLASSPCVHSASFCVVSCALLVPPAYGCFAGQTLHDGSNASNHPARGADIDVTWLCSSAFCLRCHGSRLGAGPLLLLCSVLFLPPTLISSPRCATTSCPSQATPTSALQMACPMAQKSTSTQLCCEQSTTLSSRQAALANASS